MLARICHRWHCYHLSPHTWIFTKAQAFHQKWGPVHPGSQGETDRCLYCLICSSLSMKLNLGEVWWWSPWKLHSLVSASIEDSCSHYLRFYSEMSKRMLEVELSKVSQILLEWEVRAISRHQVACHLFDQPMQVGNVADGPSCLVPMSLYGELTDGGQAQHYLRKERSSETLKTCILLSMSPTWTENFS